MATRTKAPISHHQRAQGSSYDVQDLFFSSSSLSNLISSGGGMYRIRDVCFEGKESPCNKRRFRDGSGKATACYGDDQTQFPSSNLFAAAGDGIWDNGASCGRQYLVRCISTSQPGSCTPDQTIQVKIVYHAPTAQSRPSTPSATIVLSETAFGGITNIAIDSVNIEFQL
ncbi:RING/FYVE/PHD zinc finger superfamily protein [Hibiscus syriacus]|uniref:RING/FYVE/PHD zinc finger superfamily protein n=1 Tax=Hibiscus syriacus TaxID=106335 RepID=A0A6A3CLY1_HIBSY|nr:RING/FYVE/PHD zinc finger superfamily protein [Hibiscus syriacus]